MIKNLATYRSLVGNTHNFRDLGGYRSQDGCCVRHGLLFRSDHLGKLNKKVWPSLDRLRIKNIIDLRSKQERQYQPDKLSNPYLINTHRIELPCITTDLKDFKSRVLMGTLNMDFHQELLHLYQRYVIHYGDQVSKIFSLLSREQNYPLLIHCNSGKDRVGFISALVLAALRVQREEIQQDYLLSNLYMRPYINKTLLYIRLFSLFRAKIDGLRPLLESRECYLQEIFKTINQNFGNLDNYFFRIGVSEEEQKRLKTILCK